MNVDKGKFQSACAEIGMELKNKTLFSKYKPENGQFFYL